MGRGGEMEAGLGAALTASCPCPPAPSWWSSSPACPTRPSGRWCCARPASSAPAPACWSACTTATTAWRPRSTSIGGHPPSWGGSRVARGGVPSAPCPAGWAGVPTPLILRCLLQGPSEDARVRAERQLWWAGPVPTQGSQLPRGSRRPPPPWLLSPPTPRFRKFNILTSSSKTLLAGDSPREGLICDFQYLVRAPHLGPRGAGQRERTPARAPAPGPRADPLLPHRR